MTQTLFIADLHLHESRPQITQLLVDFLQTNVNDVDALYILGDLFEAWIGDDVSMAFYPQVIEALKKFSNHCPVYFMSGNRDFLMGELFVEHTGCELLADYVVVDLYGTKTLLMHGDLLCSDDVDYQKLRVQLRNKQWQQQFLAKTPQQRLQIANDLREQSKQKTQQKDQQIMDVNPQTVLDTMDKYAVKQLIHGHTHRPDIHQMGDRKRLVLGDWYQHGSVLRVDEERVCQQELT